MFKHWLARLFVLFGLIAATIYYWPQLRELANIANTARSINNTTELQIALAREGFSPGSIDGTNGSQTKRALLAYQTAHKLPLTGIFDVTTAHDLKIQEPVFITRELTRADFSDVGNKPPNWQALGALDKLRFYSLREMIAEQSQSDPDLIDSLNPNTNWHDLSIGDTIFIPYVPPFRVSETAAYLQIKLSERALQAFSADHRLLFHCPVSIARRIEKRPGPTPQLERFGSGSTYPAMVSTERLNLKKLAALNPVDAFAWPTGMRKQYCMPCMSICQSSSSRSQARHTKSLDHFFSGRIAKLTTSLSK